ncbi:MAG: NTP transferase domain-containing protein [Deltaproteobacteria bacterium]|nr:NTP transferase domain-containing protein [Deltaproteobacteria bacterium]MBW2377318.1 NTP transferase domain-containing protein [Deltaproteobacteria bacterium]
MQAMLLAAGLGTRLQPLTDLRPKPIVPVANRALAAFAMQHLAQSGVRSIVANTHPQPERVESALKAACPPGVTLRFSREATLLGTGGGLHKAQFLFDDPQAPVTVMNGDTLFAPDLRHAYTEHLAREAVATMILRRTPNPQRFGAIGIDEEGWVRSLLGVPSDGRVRDALMFTGVHILAPEAFAGMPESGCIIRTAYRRWVDTGAPVLGIIDESPWADLGTVSEYHRLNLELASGLFAWPGVEPLDGCILPASVEPSANIRQSVVGADVEVGPGVTLDRCVVWPGTTVARSATRAVITPEHRIEVS